MIKEACVEGFAEALRAQELGANRVELCENLAAGGTTPSIGTIITCKKYLKIPVIVMIRPRGGDFVYNEQEIEIMAEDISASLSAGADGIAIGMLTRKGAIDIPCLHKLIKQAGKMQITFHKAIDATKNIENEFLRLCDLGLVHRVLTSGGASTALEGAGMLNKMIGLSNGITTILVAGKVTHSNLNDLSKLIPAGEFHGKKIVGEPDD
jgi:copper homeostasis protein